MRATVYRLQLFKPSEGFIAAQARTLPTTNVQLVGRALFGPADPGLPYWVPKLTKWSLGQFVLTSSPKRFEQAVQDHGSDLIHAHFSVDGLYALPLAERVDCPLVTTLHGFDVTTSPYHLFRSGRPALIRYALLKKRLQQRGTHFICVSRFIYEAAIRAGFPEKRLSVHYIGVDTSQFEPSVATSPARLVHVARLVEKKGTRFLIDAMALLRAKIPELSLDIIGDGPLKPSLMALARHHGLENSIRFHGTQPHHAVRKMLTGASALVLPSVRARSGDAEGLGLVLVEASAAGVPVIGTHHGGIPEAVDDGISGILVPERNAPALSEAIEVLALDTSSQTRMGRAARQLACAKFDIHRQSASLESLYRRVCQ